MFYREIIIKFYAHKLRPLKIGLFLCVKFKKELTIIYCVWYNVVIKYKGDLKVKKIPKVLHEDTLMLGDLKLKVFVLDDGQKVMTDESMQKCLQFLGFNNIDDLNAFFKEVKDAKN